MACSIWHTIAKIQCAQCSEQTSLNRDTRRGCGKSKDVIQDTFIDEWAHAAAWPRTGGNGTSTTTVCTKRRGPTRGSAGAFTHARKRLAQAKTAAMPDECTKIFEDNLQQEETAMRQPQPLGLNMDRARARLRKAVISGEKAMETLQKAHAAFEETQQDVVQAQQESPDT